MMRTGLLLFIAVLLSVPSVLAQHSGDAPGKYWIFFQDKLDAAGKTTVAAPDHITERARARRQLRGNRQAASFDAPLSHAYLAALEQIGFEPLVQSRWLNAVSVMLHDEQVDALQKLPFVTKIRPVAQFALPPDPEAASSEAPPVIAHKNLLLEYGESFTQLNVINAIEPLENGINGTGVVIGFLDTLFDFDHPSMRHIRDSGRLLGTMDFTEADQQAYGRNQTSFHGRSVSSLAVGFDEGNLIGPAYGASVLVATTEFGQSDYEKNSEEDNFVRGLEWLESQGVDVVNSSLGYNTFDAGERSYTTADLDGDTAITTRAVDIAASLGVVVVTSAGNEGTNSWRLITTPADADSVIAVGSVNSSLVLAASSGRGPTADGRIKPDVVAMGSDVWRATSTSGYGPGGGTSFSSPIVAGVVCQMLQVNPNLNPIDVRDILRSTASLGDGNENNDYGWGVIDAAAAIAAAEQHPTAIEDPTVPSPDFERVSPYPNPFSTETVFEFRAPVQAGAARLSVYNLLGQRVGTPFEGTLQPGLNRIVFQADDLPPGLYLYTLHGDRVSQSGTVVLVGE